ncbi:putative F-box protein At3g13624 [Setaria italica]|uniref:putative F-box protein At3g13624 n=1 Tax=Setaria italica TaxID=4555 RepID=UPI000BE506F5|nr:putative F-box protein At3g13624 [Setaria italica]
MAVGRELPDDLIADVVRHLPPHSLAVSRCVCRAWRDLVDARRLLRADLLPRSVGGIFMNYRALYSPEFFSRPTTGPSISGDLGFIPGFSTVVDHCNGLLLVTETSDDYVANPATRRWARLPPRPTSQMGEACDQIECLVYDPTVSPHYNVLDPVPP